jgi:MoaA/NifB/PqqE/SkfB family radical SAM enzyme
MFTNGWYLEEKAHDLHAAGLDTIYVSIDSADPETHDAMRKLKGLYGRSMDGIRQAKKIGLMTGLSSCIYEEDIENGNLERLIELGKELGVQEHVIFDAMPSGRLKKRSDLMKRGDWIATLEKKIEPYNKDDSYPGILIYGYVTSHKSSGCACGVSTFYLSPYGDISSCDFNPQPVGNITQDPLYRIWERFATMPNFKSAAWGGCKVKDPEFQAKMKNEGSLASQEQDAIIDDNDGSCACDANACR